MDTIKLSKCSISQEDVQSVVGALSDEYLGMGPRVQEFEDQLSKFFGRPAVAVSSGTAALHLALQAIKAPEGSEVLVPTITYVASFQAICAARMIPIACDVDSKTLCISVDDARSKFSPKTVAIMPVHFMGGAGSFQSILNFAKEKEIRVIEDAAHAFGSLHKNKLIGSFGDVSCFSFDGIKNITCGEGGCVVSSDLNVIEMVRDARSLGVSKDHEKRYSRQRSWDFDVFEQGWRYHMSDVMAAIGLSQFERLQEFKQKRQMLAKRYDKELADFPLISNLKQDYSQIMPHIYPIIIEGSIDRDDLRSFLAKNQIETGIHYSLNHRLTKFRQYRNGPMPVAEKLADRLLSLPLHVDMQLSQLDHVVGSLSSYFNQYS